MPSDQVAPSVGEFDLIERYLRPLATSPGAFKLQDDAAVISAPNGYEIVVSKDILVADVHFFPSDPPDAIAKKALRVNISDIIAKGARPVFYSLGLVFPTPPTDAFMAAFAKGLAEDQTAYGLSLLGGDTTSSKADFMISVTMVGWVPSGAMKTRLTAKKGDRLYVSGDIGASALGLALRTGDLDGASLSTLHREMLLSRYLLPTPPKGLETAISHHASASMDVSDGLFADLKHLAKASGVNAKVDADALPFCHALQEVLQLFPKFEHVAMWGGDDYQSLVCVSPDQCEPFEAAAAASDNKVVRIGEIVDGPAGTITVWRNGERLDFNPQGFTHF